MASSKVNAAQEAKRAHIDESASSMDAGWLDLTLHEFSRRLNCRARVSSTRAEAALYRSCPCTRMKLDVPIEAVLCRIVLLASMGFQDRILPPHPPARLPPLDPAEMVPFDFQLPTRIVFGP